MGTGVFYLAVPNHTSGLVDVSVSTTERNGSKTIAECISLIELKCDSGLAIRSDVPPFAVLLNGAKAIFKVERFVEGGWDLHPPAYVDVAPLSVLGYSCFLFSETASMLKLKRNYRLSRLVDIAPAAALLNGRAIMSVTRSQLEMRAAHLR